MIYVSISHSASQGAFSKLQILEGLILLINEPNTKPKFSDEVISMIVS